LIVVGYQESCKSEEPIKIYISKSTIGINKSVAVKANKEDEVTLVLYENRYGSASIIVRSNDDGSTEKVILCLRYNDSDVECEDELEIIYD